ncbi:MAG: cytochrome C oxidase subunit IV family protein [SAR324 cluster bacterium]|nr:cytochrome C oxidase subunit IV family protein [SAR324 cluster bacterium]
MSEETNSTHPHPVKIWVILLILFIISVAGPMLGHPIVTLITAFGIALVKALTVAAYYMHLKIEKHYIWYAMFCGVLALIVLFTGLAPDIMKKQGTNWKNCMADHSCVQQRL